MNKDRFDREFLAETPPTDEGLLKDEEIQYSPELNVHHYERQLAQKHNRWLPTQKVLGKVWLILAAIAVWITKMFRQKKTRPYFLIVLAVVIISILGLSISTRRASNRDNLNLLEAQAILREAEAAEEDAKMANLSSDESKAQELYGACLEKSAKIINIGVVKSSAQDLTDKCQKELDKLTDTTRFDKLKPVLTSEGNTKNFYIASGQVFFVSKDQIFRASIAGGSLTKVATLPKNNGDFQFGAVSGGSLYLYTSAQKVYEFKTETNKLELVKINGSWETANAASYYAGNLYLLDGIMGQIYRHTSGQNAFEAGQAYISSASVDVKNSASLAIDGSIYVLRATGEVLELQKGKLMDFSLRDIPSPQSELKNPLKVYTDADTTSLYILDGGAKRVVEFDKDGRFVHQYALPSDFENLTDFTVSVKAKKMWVLNENQLYEISI